MSIEIVINGFGRTLTAPGQIPLEESDARTVIESTGKSRSRRTSTSKRMTKPKVLFIVISSVCLSMSGLRGSEVAPGAGTPTALPLLVDLGAGRCVPCRLMAPILAELEKDYAGQLKVTFIDVLKNRAEGGRFGVLVIPTQIFYDATGRERFRHEGFMAKKDILAKWEELGVELKVPPAEKKS